jgi:hypothetical protein
MEKGSIRSQEKDDRHESDPSQSLGRDCFDSTGGNVPPSFSLEGMPFRKRRTSYIRLDLDEKIRAYAYWERLGLSEVVNLALGAFFAGKEVKAIPPKRCRLGETESLRKGKG